MNKLTERKQQEQKDEKLKYCDDNTNGKKGGIKRSDK